MRKIILFICLVFLFFHTKAQPVCNGVLGTPIVNVTFGQGNNTQAAYSPFSTYAPGLTTNTTLQPSGFLGAANTSGLVKNGSTFGSAPQWLATPDHTGNNYGLFMGINMPDNIGDTVVEYVMTGLCPNTTMQYSIWLVNLMAPTHPMVVSGNPLIQYPNMIMRIVDASNNVIGTFNTGNVPTDGIWHQYAYLFNNGSSSTVRLQLINNTYGSSYGNDVALDDITVRPCVPDADISPKLDTTFCETKALTFTANITSNVYNPANYQWQYSTNQGNTWNNAGAPSTNNTFNFTFSTTNAPAEYWIRYLVSPGNTSAITNCHATSDTSKIRIDTIAPFHLPPDTTICSNISLHLSAAGANASNYLWSTGATASNINVSTAGNYWAIASSLYGCKKSDTINVNVTQVNNPVLGNDTAFCTGTQYNLNAGNINATSYLWNTGATGPGITVNTSGNYWVKAFFGNCSSSDTVHIDFNPAPEVNLGNDTSFCSLTTYTLNAATANATGYLWNTGASTPFIQVNTSGTYWVKVSYLNCFSTDTIQVDFSQHPIPDLGNDTSFCEGFQYTLNIADISADSYLWNTGAAGTALPINTSGNYWVKAFFGNCFTSDSVRVDFNEYPVVDLGADTTICEGTELTLKSIENYPDALYKWNNNTNGHSLSIESAAKYWLTITNPPDCAGSDSITIKTSKCKCDLMVPNAFSPNGDGINEVYLPRLIFEGCPLDHYMLYIYNRWGQAVFFSADPHKGWDGYMNHKPADAGTYMYYIRFLDWISGETKTYKGDLTLIR